MRSDSLDPRALDRRDFVKTAGMIAAGAAVYPYLGCAPMDSGGAAGATPARLVGRPPLRARPGTSRRGAPGRETGPDAPLCPQLRERHRPAGRTGPPAQHLPGECRSRYEGRPPAWGVGRRGGLPQGPLRRALHEHAGAGLRGDRGRGLQAEAGLHGRHVGGVPGRAGRGGGPAHPAGQRTPRRRAPAHGLTDRPRRAR